MTNRSYGLLEYGAGIPLSGAWTYGGDIDVLDQDVQAEFEQPQINAEFEDPEITTKIEQPDIQASFPNPQEETQI